MRRWRVALATLVVCIACAALCAGANVEFLSPTDGATVSGRTLTVATRVYAFLMPQGGHATLLHNGRHFIDIRENEFSLLIEGLGGWAEGQHELKLVLKDASGAPVLGEAGEATVRFTKVGDPNDYIGPYMESRFDDETLGIMTDACADAVARRAQEGGGAVADWMGVPRSGPAMRVALALPVVSSLVAYNGGLDDDLTAGVARGVNETEADNLLVVTHFLPSMRASLGDTADNGIVYTIWFGFDQGDVLYDDATVRRHLDDKIAAMFPPHDVRTKGKVFAIYNDLMRQAYGDDADYFFMVNDDLLFETQGWARAMIQALQGSAVHPNFGVAGPLETRDPFKHHMTFSFHHRTHYDALGYFFPEVFPNWWSDYWVSLVYGANATFWRSDVKIKNTEDKGRRYPAYWAPNDVFVDALREGRSKLAAYCQCLALGGRPRYSGCIA